jgi:hypothetical protein
MAGRTPAAIEAWKQSEVMLISAHGEITNDAPPIVPRDNMLVLQTGQLGCVIYATSDDPLMEQMRPENKAGFYATLFSGGQTPANNLMKLLHVAAPGEQTLPKRLHYSLPDDAEIMPGVYRITNGVREYFSPDLDRKLWTVRSLLSMPGGITTGQLLEVLGEILPPDIRWTIIISSCSSIGSARPHRNTVLKVGPGIGGLSQHSVRPTYTRFMDPAAHNTALSVAAKTPTMNRAGNMARSNAAAGTNIELPTNREYGIHQAPDESFDPDRLNRRHATYIEGLQPAKVPRSYSLTLEWPDGRIIYYSDETGLLVQFASSAQLQRYVITNQDVLRAVAEKAAPATFHVREFVGGTVPVNRVMTLQEFMNRAAAKMFRYGGGARRRHRTHTKKLKGRRGSRRNRSQRRTK